MYRNALNNDKTVIPTMYFTMQHDSGEVLYFTVRVFVRLSFSACFRFITWVAFLNFLETLMGIDIG